ETVATMTGSARIGAGVLVVGTRLWLFGGFDGNGFLTSTESAAINGDATLGAFVAGPAMTIDRAVGGAVQLGNHVYLVGGVSTNNGQSTNPTGSTVIESAPINADDSLGAFTVSVSSALAVGRQAFGNVQMIGNYLYAIGGGNGTNAAVIERASFDAGSALSAFSDAGISLHTPRRNAGSIVLGHWLYVIGGQSGAPLASIERAQILDDNGTLGAFADAGVALPTAIAYPVVGAFGSPNPAIYVYDSANGTMLTQNQDGSLGGTGTTVPQMQHARTQFHWLAFGATLYAAGGLVNGNPDTTIETNSFLTPAMGGGLGPNWALLAGATVPNAHDRGLAAVIGNNIYGWGGAGASESAAIDIASSSSGVLGPFATSPATTVDGRSDAIALVRGANLFVIGGFKVVTSGPATLDAKDEQAAISGTLNTPVPPTLGTFTLNSSVPTLRYGAVGTVVGNSIYVIGGNDQTTDLGLVEKATLQ
ncbi:MAG TPA: hypothetical protein VGL86_20880, partial [Polyangia bacterium]